MLTDFKECPSFQKHKRAAIDTLTSQDLYIQHSEIISVQSHSLHTSCTSKQVLTCSGLRKSKVYHKGQDQFVCKAHVDGPASLPWIGHFYNMHSIQNPLHNTPFLTHTTHRASMSNYYSATRYVVTKGYYKHLPTVWQQHQHSTLPQEQEVRAG